MERADRAARDAILGRVFPGLGPGKDPEIERYFRLRAAGRTAEALSLFDRVLKVRYPDEGRRSALFNLFRRGDPMFPAYHDELLWDLYDSTSARIRDTLDRICLPVCGIPPKDAYRLLAALETAMRLLPEGREAALARLDELSAFAKILGHRTGEVVKVRALAASYFERVSAGGAEPSVAFGGLVGKPRASRRRVGSGDPEDGADPFDLSRAKLSAGDIDRVEIPAGSERLEDRALAFCFKYWKASEDPAFERLVLLYSRARGGPHHEVLRVIREGRASETPDEEILGRVAAVLSPGYSYTTQGDLYMRRAWKALKARMDPGDGGTKIVKAPKPGKAAPERDAVRKPAAPRPAKSAQKAPRKRSAPAGESSPRAADSRPPAPRGSVSDRIKALSGKRYDVYREEFLARVGPAIRDRLSERRIKPKDAFEDPLGRAEDLIRDFLERNYANPYMDWEGSDTRARVEDLGFSVQDLEGIIALWYSRRGK